MHTCRFYYNILSRCRRIVHAPTDGSARAHLLSCLDARSTSEVELVLDKMAELQEEIRNTNIEEKKLVVKTVATKLLESPFVTRENSAFDQVDRDMRRVACSHLGR